MVAGRDQSRRGVGGRRNSPGRSPDLAETLDGIARSVSHAAAAVTVCTEALRHQDAEMDVEIALVLQRGAGDRLAEALQKLRELEHNLRVDWEDHEMDDSSREGRRETRAARSRRKK